MTVRSGQTHIITSDWTKRTVDAGASTDAVSGGDNLLNTVELRLGVADHIRGDLAVGDKVAEETSGLQVSQIVLDMGASLNDKNLQGRVRIRQTTRDKASSGST